MAEVAYTFILKQSRPSSI